LRTGYNLPTLPKYLLLTTQLRAKLPPAIPEDHRNEATAIVLLRLAAPGRPFLRFVSITPASDILHELARHKSFGVRLFSEDEIAAVCSAIAPALPTDWLDWNVRSGVALKQEAIAAVMMSCRW